MANILEVDGIKFYRGLKATMPTLEEGQPGFCTDTKEFYIGSDNGNILHPDQSKWDELNNSINATNGEVALKANTDDVNTALSGKANKNDLDTTNGNVSALSSSLAQNAKYVTETITTDEIIYFKSDSVKLFGLNADTSTIVIKNSGKTVTYAKDVDYSFSYDTNTKITTINRITTGAITSLQSVICNYTFTREKQKAKPSYIKNTVRKLVNNETVKIVFFGDSTTEQNSTTQGFDNHVGILNTWLTTTYPNAAITVVNKGISGNTSIDGVNRMQQDILELSPDLVIMCFGINDRGQSFSDTLFRLAMNTLVKACLGSGIEVILRTPNTIMSGEVWELNDPYMRKFQRVTKEIALKHNVTYVEVYDEFVSLIQNGYSNQNDLAPDKTHPNARSHQFIADLMKPYFLYENVVSVDVPRFRTVKCYEDTKLFAPKWGAELNSPEFGGKTLSNNKRILSSMRYSFYGTEIYATFSYIQQGGMVDVYIDGSLVQTIDTYHYAVDPYGKYEYNHYPFLLADNLSEGQHLLELKLTDQRNASSTGYKARIAYLIHNDLQRNDIKVFQTESELVKTGAWVTNTAADSNIYYNGVSCTTSTVGDKIEFSFVGTEFSILGVMSNASGMINVNVDGVSQGDIDLYVAGLSTKTFDNSAYTRNVLLFSKRGLKEQKHKVILTVATKNASSGANQVNFQGIITDGYLI